MANLEIAGRPIGGDNPPYVIAEMSASHGGSYEEAADLVRLAAVAGVEAVKLQTYTAETMTVRANTEWMRIGPGSPWEGRNLFELYEEAHTPWDWHADLLQVARDAGIELFSTAFDRTSVDFLEELGVRVHKVASFEMVDHELIAYVASTGRPLILSTGMATLVEIAEAVDVARANGATQIALLRCTSAYPAEPEHMNLRAIPAMKAAFGVEVGLSDHSLGIAIPIVAVGLGASLVEKHFARSSETRSADSSFSAGLEELGSMVDALRRAHAALGSVRFGPTDAEQSGLAFRRSIFAIADVEPGELLTRKNVGVIRPGFGLPPKYLPQVLGRRASRFLALGTPLAWESLDT